MYICIYGSTSARSVQKTCVGPIASPKGEVSPDIHMYIDIFRYTHILI